MAETSSLLNCRTGNRTGGSNPPLTAENGITDNCSAVFAFSVTNNVTKIQFKRKVICKKLQVALIVFEREEDWRSVGE